MFGECHAHIIMDGINFQKAMDLHRTEVEEHVIHSHFQEYQKKKITFVRDGGDAFGVSERAKKIAPQYQIDYRSPMFAIHRKRRYGSIVGKSFEDMKEFHQRVCEAKALGADFIKIMTTGIMDFSVPGFITGTPLEAEEVKEMVHIAHEEGFAVMSHTNGSQNVQIALEAGVDSIEHGNYMDEETIRMFADTDTVWVPTLVTVRNLLGCGRFPDEAVRKIMKMAEESLKLAYQSGVLVAIGSDAGAYQVMHGQGTMDEVTAVHEILGNGKELDDWLGRGEAVIRKKFCYCT